MSALEGVNRHSLPSSPAESRGGPGRDWIPRRAKLFEAGDYPDKGVSVRTSDLQRLVDGFTGPVPVLLEHAASPLELGYLTHVDVSDTELFGNLSFSPEAHALIERSGARSLSLGLSTDLDAILEVSLVQQPRIPDARLFGASVAFSGQLLEPDATYWRRECERLRQERRHDQATERVARWVGEGRLTPAQAEAARALLSCDTTVGFGETQFSVSRWLTQLVEATPAVSFRETAPNPTQPRHALFLPEEEAFYRTHFPDVPLTAIAEGRTSSTVPSAPHTRRD